MTIESAKRQLLDTVTIDAGNIAANTTLDVTAAVPYAKLGQRVSVNPPAALEAGVVVGGAWVSAANQITIRLANVTGLAIDPVSADYLVAISY